MQSYFSLEMYKKMGKTKADFYIFKIILTFKTKKLFIFFI